MGRMKHSSKRGLGFWSAVSIGIGGMIGAGIFSILGPAAEIAGTMVCAAFVFAGLVALLNAYNYAKMSVRYPSAGGPVEFLVRGLGDNVATGGLNILLWAGYIVVMSLYVRAFAAYFITLFSITRGMDWIIMSGIVSFFTLLNFKGSQEVGKSELIIVGIKLFFLILFGSAGIVYLIPHLLVQATEWNSLNLIFATAFVFLAYEGFGLISNTAEDIADPEKMLPKALYSSVIIVMGVYLLVSFVVTGSLSPAEIKASSDYALARAAQPFLGGVGFVLMSLAALFSTSSAINATLYGGANVSYLIGKYGELPKSFERRLWRRGTEGLIITALLVLLLALSVNLESIAIIGSASFLMIYAGVGLAHFMRSEETGGRKSFIGLSILLDVGLFAFLVAYVGTTAPLTAFGIILVLWTSILAEWAYRKAKNRGIRCRTQK